MPFFAGDDVPAATMEKIANPPRARVLANAAQNFLNNTFTEIIFQEQDFVYGITHDPIGFPTRFTATVDGIYFLTGGMAWGTNGTGVRALKWQKNGVDIPGGGSNVGAYTPGQPMVAARPTMVSLSVGDYVCLLGSQSSTVTLASYVSVDYIRPDMSIRLIRDSSL